MNFIYFIFCKYFVYYFKENYFKLKSHQFIKVTLLLVAYSVYILYDYDKIKIYDYDYDIYLPPLPIRSSMQGRAWAVYC